jgi:uncharacterized membrane protein
MFVATFVYCVAAALSIPSADVQLEGAQLTATVGVYLMLATFATLIVLVQHISTMLQAPNIAAAAGAELREVVSAHLSSEVMSDGAAPAGSEARAAPEALNVPTIPVETESYPVRARSTGYIQYIDPEILLTLARDRELVIRLLRKPGNWVQSGATVALVWPAERVDEQLEKLLRRAFEIGNGRTPTQDIEYAVNQLTEMAVRAMSPAINDPFTAMTCLDHLGAGLAQFVQRGERGSAYYDREGRLRLVLEPVTFAELLDAAFAMLRHASCDSASVLLHMLTVIEVIGEVTESPAARQLLRRHVSLIRAESEAGNLIEQDRQAIHQRGESLEICLEGAS